MPSKPVAIKAKTLQSLLTRIGCASSGTKSVLRARFEQSLPSSRLFGLRPEWSSARPKARKLRIVSIDMGIKNLAFCDAEVEYAGKKSKDARMQILRWEKVDLEGMSLALEGLRSKESATRDKGERKGGNEEEVVVVTDIDPYSSSSLSKTAYTLIKNTILTTAPDIILIEKQRWRSGGGAAVLQWTVRVNTLEGMLWAVLETLRSERKRSAIQSSGSVVAKKNKSEDFEVFAVDPKRVGQYWLGQSEVSLLHTEGAKTVSKSKAEKKAKIAILRSWLQDKRVSNRVSSRDETAPSIEFKFNKEAEAVRQALCFPVKAVRRGSKSSSMGVGKTTDTDLKKLDDITDCFLQAAAWVSWESNRLQLMDIWERKGKKGEGGEIGEDALLEMGKVVDGESGERRE